MRVLSGVELLCELETRHTCRQSLNHGFLMQYVNSKAFNPLPLPTNVNGSVWSKRLCRCCYRFTKAAHEKVRMIDAGAVITLLRSTSPIC